MSCWILFSTNLLTSSFSSLTAPMKFVPQSLIISFSTPLRLVFPVKAFRKLSISRPKCYFQMNCESRQAKPPLLMVHTSSLYRGKRPRKVHCCSAKGTKGEPKLDLRKHPWSVLMTSSSTHVAFPPPPPILESPQRLRLPNTSHLIGTAQNCCWMVGLFIVIFNN